jgi:hypothetical protein
MVVAGVVALATAPAAAAQEQRPLAWFDAEAGVPATVDFADVAASGSTLIAVGSEKDEAAGVDGAAVYRWDGATWTREQIAAAPPGSTLTDVAVNGAQAWAVGTQPDSQGGASPLVLRLASGGWVPPAATLPDFEPTAVAVHGAKALVGARDGTLHTFNADGTGAPTKQEPVAAGPINDLSLFGEGLGFAVADFEAALPGPSPLLGPNSVRIYSLKPQAEPDYAAASATPGVHMKGVAAAGNVGAVAVDDTLATWHANSEGNWIQDGVVAAGALNAVAALPELDAAGTPTGYLTEMLVGSAGETASAAIWQRRRWKHHDGAWQPATSPAGAGPLTGVAITGPESAWAVGVDGTVLRYWRKPATAEEIEAERLRLAAEEEERQRRAAEEAERQRLAEEEQLRREAEEEEAERLRQEELARQQQEQAPAEEQAAPPAEEPPPPPPPPAPPERDRFSFNGVVVDDSTAPRPGAPDTGQRLLKDVKALRKGHRLIVSFRLTATARVALTAKRGRRVIARTGMRTLRRGRRTLVLRYRGKPPSSLKVVVRRVRTPR